MTGEPNPAIGRRVIIYEGPERRSANGLADKGAPAEKPASGGYGYPGDYSAETIGLEARYDVGEFFVLLRHFKYYFFLIAAIILCGTYAYTKYYMPPTFTASMEIVDNSVEQRMAATYTTIEGKRTPIAVAFIFREKIVPNAKRGILEKYPGMSEEEKTALLASGASANYAGNVLIIDVKSDSIAYISELTYTLGRLFVTEEQKLEEDKARTYREFLEMRRDERRAELDRAQQSIIDYLLNDPDIRTNLKDSGIGDWLQFKDNLLARLRRYENYIEETRLDYEAAIGKLSQIEYTLETEPEYIEREATVYLPGERPAPPVEEKEPVILLQLQARLVQLEIELIEALIHHTESSPKVKDLRNRISKLRTIEEKVRRDFEDGKPIEIEGSGTVPVESRPEHRTYKVVNPVKDRAKADLVFAKYDVQLYKRKVAILEGDIERLQSKADAMPPVETEYKRLGFEKDIVETDYIETLRKLRDLEGPEGVKDDTYEFIVDQERLLAEVDAAKAAGKDANEAYTKFVRPSTIMPNMMRNMGLGFVVSLLIWLGLIYFFEITEKRIRKPSELKRLLGFKTLGVILRKAGDLLIIDKEGRTTPLAEAYRVMNNTIYYAFPTRKRKVMMVTSSFKGEGKTVTSVNLGISAALDGKKVAIIDADLRSPSTQNYIMRFIGGEEPEAGLSSFLDGSARLKDIIHETSIEGLDWIPAGARCDNPAKYLLSDRTSGLFDYLNREYDLIIVDVPPVLPVVDPTILIPYVHGVLLVVGYKCVRRQFAQETLERLRHVNAPILGAIITKAPKNAPYAPSYGYTYYHKLYR